MSHVVVGGVRLETRIIPGSAAKPWLVFLHEGLGCVALWREFPDLVARRTGCPALIYSRRGYGKSDRLAGPRRPDFMHEEALAVLPDLLRRNRIELPILVGHSDGASIALIHAASSPAAARGAVLMAPHVKVEPVSVDSIARIAASYETSGLRERLSRYHDHVDDAFRGWSDIWLDPAFRDWSLHAEAAKLSAPLLLIQGADDEYGTLAQIEETAARAQGPQEQLVLERCGHSPHRDRPEAVLDAICRFVEGMGVL
jgi:pimeloyl-ACP methyl ester carboxylesterase